ncbi:hypothetical protein BJ684DRAFT_11464 [Piptocephalis cylindrospora]|uniref:Pan3 C-terminal knob domain-containing protein n=1 Tax=Piptocephalis cylindrospora TaxID=1907219 RepID=A0A4P9Y120_9FUNG|nr:hypothetical protein BJ684DRAFT_11464 [Piptocephalis cylindrospora]|eukprot:RKP12447.1 hypothetical protein BJ684DRAFT_11464 [Piptocephalis cylindrospora]
MSEAHSDPTLEEGGGGVKGIPREVGSYHTIRPMPADPHERLISLTGVKAHVYTGISRYDGLPYCLRRLESIPGVSANLGQVVEAWQRVRHANVLALHEVFTTQAFGDTSLVLVYTYEPLSHTLLQEHFSPETDQGHPIPESTLWTYMTQLLSALKAIHSAGLAARVYDASNILLLDPRDGHRVRVACCGLLDMLPGDPSKTVQHLQQEDMLHFGQLLLSLACQSMNAVHALPRSLEHLASQYSPDCKNVILYLLSKPNPLKNLDDVLAMMGPRLLYELDAAQYAMAGLENHLSRELENSRILRLLIKLGSINERPEFDQDPRWSETGDRYLLKLLRDHLFHQVDEHGRPNMDMGHVIRCLNKLDAGVPERVVLLSRDERSCLVVSYRELKGCVESAYQELLHAS